MRILFYQWHSFMNQGMERALQQMQIPYDRFFYQQTDWEKNDGLAEKLEQKLKERSYAMVLSVNFAPVVSEVCQNSQVLYVSWVYDAPIHIRNLTPLKNTCNRIFFFDRIQAEGYQKQGIFAYHMPLAADIDSFYKKSRAGAAADISFVGKLYHTEYAYYCTPLRDDQKGYLDGILQAQLKVYGGYFLGEMLDDQLLGELNERYQSASHGSVAIQKEELEYMMACEITRRERFLALALLSNHFQVDLYAPEEDSQLTRVRYRGYADYYHQMPEVFQTSRINLNISLKIIQSGIPLRVFDVLGSGGFLLTNFQPEMPELFELGHDFAVYESMGDLFEQADYYLRHDAEREKIAQQGYEKVKACYTFRHQMEKIWRMLKPEI